MNEPSTSKVARGTDSAEALPSDGQGGSSPDQPSITPVPVRPRRHGWTVERQNTIIEAHAQTRLVEEA